MTVFDVAGAAVMNIDNSGQAMQRIDISNLDIGMYVLRLTGEDAAGVIRFIKN